MNQSATGTTVQKKPRKIGFEPISGRHIARKQKGNQQIPAGKNIRPTSTLPPSFPLVRRCIPAVPVSATKLRLPLRLTRVFRLLSHTCPEERSRPISDQSAISDHTTGGDNQSAITRGGNQSAIIAGGNQSAIIRGGNQSAII